MENWQETEGVQTRSRLSIEKNRNRIEKTIK